jgi:hypothetical protein
LVSVFKCSLHHVHPLNQPPPFAEYLIIGGNFFIVGGSDAVVDADISSAAFGIGSEAVKMAE